MNRDEQIALGVVAFAVFAYLLFSSRSPPPQVPGLPIDSQPIILPPILIPLPVPIAGLGSCTCGYANEGGTLNSPVVPGSSSTFSVDGLTYDTWMGSTNCLSSNVCVCPQESAAGGQGTQSLVFVTGPDGNSVSSYNCGVLQNAANTITWGNAYIVSSNSYSSQNTSSNGIRLRAPEYQQHQIRFGGIEYRFK